MNIGDRLVVFGDSILKHLEHDFEALSAVGESGFESLNSALKRQRRWCYFVANEFTLSVVGLRRECNSALVRVDSLGDGADGRGLRGEHSLETGERATLVVASSFNRLKVCLKLVNLILALLGSVVAAVVGVWCRIRSRFDTVRVEASATV